MAGESVEASMSHSGQCRMPGRAAPLGRDIPSIFDDPNCPWTWQAVGGGVAAGVEHSALLKSLLIRPPF